MMHWLKKYASLTTVLISIALVSVLFLTNNLLRFNRFKQSQIQIAQTSTERVAGELGHIIKEQRRLTKLFFLQNKNIIDDFLSHPEGELFAELDQKLSLLIPDHFSFTISRSNGEQIGNHFNEKVGETCLQDIQAKAAGKEVKIRIHPSSYQYHYDIIYPFRTQRHKGLILVGFQVQNISRLLKLAEPVNQSLMLLSQSRPFLIEVTSQGSRNQLSRDNFVLSKHEQEHILAHSKVALTDWTLVSVAREQLFAQYRQFWLQNFLINALILILIFSYSVAQSIFIDRKRLKLAKSLAKTRVNLKEKIQHKTASLQKLNEQLKKQVDKTRKLAEEKNRFASLLTGSPDPILCCDAFGKVTYQNLATEVLLNELDLDDIVHFLPDTHEEQVELAKHVMQCVAEVRFHRRHFHYIYNYVSEADETFIYIREITRARNFERKLLNNQAEMEAIFRSCPDAIIYTDSKHIIRKVNAAVETIYGYQAGTLIGKEMAVFYPDAEQFEAMLDHFEQSNHVLECRHIDAQGKAVDCEVARSSILDEKQQRSGFVYITRDIGERIKSEQKIRDNERFLSNLTSVLAEGIYVIDKEVNLVFMNNEAEDLLGWSFHNLKQHNVHETIHNLNGMGIQREQCPIYNTLQNGQVQIIEDDYFFRSDGSKFPVRYTVAAMRNEQNEISGAVVAFQDITEQKQLQKKLEVMATTDPVTQINNRHSLEIALEREISRAQRYDRPLSLFMVDIDFFKKINDIHGHHIGDEALYAFAQLLKKEVRDSDFVGRYGGEEFIVLLPETDLKTAARLAERLRTAIQNLKIPASNGETLTITASIGVSSYPQTATDMESLQTSADHAVYHAKTNGRNQVQLAAMLDHKIIQINKKGKQQT